MNSEVNIQVKEISGRLNAGARSRRMMALRLTQLLIERAVGSLTGLDGVHYIPYMILHKNRYLEYISGVKLTCGYREASPIVIIQCMSQRLDLHPSTLVSAWSCTLRTVLTDRELLEFF